MDTKQFNDLVGTAKKQWENDNEVLQAFRKEHAGALAELQQVEAERARLERIVAEFEDDLESDIGPAEFEEAAVKLRSNEVMLKRAQLHEKRTSEKWQNAERKRHSNARRARGGWRFDSRWPAEARNAPHAPALTPLEMVAPFLLAGIPTR